VISPTKHEGDIMQKTKSKAARFLKLDKLGQKILQISRSIAKTRKERAERSFQNRLINQTGLIR